MRLFVFTKTIFLGTLIARSQIIAEKENVQMNMSIFAYDCGGRRSNPVGVSVLLFPTCQAGLKGDQLSWDRILCYLLKGCSE